MLRSTCVLDLPDYDVLDKQVLVGGCVRLPLRVDARRLRDEVAALPADLWGSSGGRVGVHRAAEALFLRGHAPAQGNLLIEDRAALSLLPYVRELITVLVAARPLRCLLARLPAQAIIAPHIDCAPYFSKSLRLHFPVQTHDRAWMLCAGLGYLMQAGEVWVLNNCAEHAVWNAHPSLSRTHLICDFLPDAALLDLLARGERSLGRPVPEVEAHIRAAARERLASG
jgi:hypothetical protein